MRLDEAGLLHLDPGIMVEETRTRRLDELTGVYLDQAACQGSSAAYFMYNGVFRQADAADLAGLPVRYELTLLPDRRIGREYLKTHGHIHTREPRSGIDYPEICEVLVGKAHFFFQNLEALAHRPGGHFMSKSRPGRR